MMEVERMPVDETTSEVKWPECPPDCPSKKFCDPGSCAIEAVREALLLAEKRRSGQSQLGPDPSSEPDPITQALDKCPYYFGCANLEDEYCLHSCTLREACIDTTLEWPLCPSRRGKNCEYYIRGRCYAGISRLRRFLCRWWPKNGGDD